MSDIDHVDLHASVHATNANRTYIVVDLLLHVLVLGPAGYLRLPESDYSASDVITTNTSTIVRTVENTHLDSCGQ